MIVTEAQVQDIQTTIKAELIAGTFILYKETPQIHIDSEKKTSKNAWINLTNSLGDIIYAVNNSPILFDDSCDLWIHSPNRSDIDKIYADIINIFSESSKNIIIRKPKDIPLRSKYVKKMQVKLLDI